MAEVLSHTVTDIDGNVVDLETYRGKVLLFVNVASRCGFTRQYEGLEKLWRSYRDRGLVVLGFPSNDFAAQEPGSEAEIKEFCFTRYGVTFPMFSKVPVKGPGKAPVYDALSTAAGEPEWNFHKYLVGRDGKVLKAFIPSVSPADRRLLQSLELALG